MVGSALGGAAELAERDDRNLEFLRQNLDRAGDRRELGLAAFEPAASLHQLQIVDDEHVESVLELQPAGLGAHLEDADARRVVDEHLRVVKPAERLDQPRVVLLAEKAAAESMSIHARF